MNHPKAEEKKETTIDELEAQVLPLHKQDKALTAEIDALTTKRTTLRKEIRAFEGRITTKRMQAKAEG